MIRVPQPELRAALAKLKMVAPARATLPITQNVLIQVEDAFLKLTTTDLETALSMRLGAQIDAPISFSVPVRPLFDLVSSFPKEPVELTVEDVGGYEGLVIRCGERTAQMAGAPATDFPPLPEVPVKTALVVYGGPLRRAIKRVLVAVATEDSRPVLTGVKLDVVDEPQVRGQTVTLVGADGFRLAIERYIEQLPCEEPLGAQIIPAKVLEHVVRALDKTTDDEAVLIASHGTILRFSIEGAEIVAHMIQGTFPDYGALDPPDYETHITVDHAELAEAVKAAGSYARSGSGIVRLEPVQTDTPGIFDGLRITVYASELGTYATTILAQVSSEGRAAFDHRYLYGAMAPLAGGSVEIALNTPSSPARLTSSEVPGYRYICMPMFVQWSDPAQEEAADKLTAEQARRARG